MATRIDPRTGEIEEPVALVQARQTGIATFGGMTTSLADMKTRLRALQQFREDILDEGTDYMTISGTGKPTLLKPGAEKLFLAFGLTPDLRPAEIIRDWSLPLLAYRYECRAISRSTGEVIANGFGSANSREPKYRYRLERPMCPACNKELFKSRQAPEWFCWRSKGGCGQVYGFDRVPEDAAKQVENTDVAELDNTLDKMAQKRALVACALIATATSGMFTQDLEDLTDSSHGEESSRRTAPPAQQNGAARPAQPQNRPQQPAQQQKPAQQVQQEPAKPKSLPPVGEEFLDKAGRADANTLWSGLKTIASERRINIGSDPPETATVAGVRAAIRTAEAKTGFTAIWATATLLERMAKHGDKVVSEQTNEDEDEYDDAPEMPSDAAANEVPF